MNVSGSIKVKNEVQQVSEKFRKMEFVVTITDTQYPQHLLFQLNNDNTSMLDNFDVGDQVTVYFKINGREWTSPKNEVRYFNTLECLSIEQVFDHKERKSNPGTLKSSPATQAEEDLPF